MKLAKTLRRWWAEVETPRRSAGGGPDHADMGTAFGLDATIGTVEHGPPLDLSEGDTQPSHWTPSWEERLARRGV